MRKMLVLMAAALMLAGCGDKGKELYETAQFEEKQYNAQHASELYKEILERYPESPYAAKAKVRLAELEQ